MKKILLIITVCIMSIMVVACSGTTSAVEGGNTSSSDQKNQSEKASESVKLKMLAIPYYENFINTAFEAFKKSDSMYANYSLDLETVPFNQLFEVIEVKIASGDSDYDLMYVDGPVVSAYGHRGYLHPLDEYFNDDELALWEESSLQTSFYKDDLLAVPLDASGLVLFYNKAILEEAGIPIPSNDPDDRLTWEQIEEYGIQIMENINPNRDNGKYAFVQHQVSRTYEMLPLPYSLGGVSIGKDGFTAEGIVNSTEWVDAMEFYGDMFGKHEYSPKGIEAPATVEWFSIGNVGFISTQSSYAQKFLDAGIDLGYTHYPSFENGRPVQTTDSWHIGVNTYSKQPEKAIPFLKFMTLGDGAQIKTETMGGISSLKSEMSRLVKDSDDFTSGIMQIIKNDFQYGIPRPIMEGYREYDLIMNETFEDIRNGSDPKESLDYAAEKIERNLEQYR